VEWRAVAGEQFPSEDIKEQVVFASFERGFNLPAGDFFYGLLYYYLSASNTAFLAIFNSRAACRLASIPL
jgi:hypothetical protein